MAIRRIYRIDDPEDKKTLKMHCRPLKLPDTRLPHLLADMFETMHAAQGVGLAAPQIGLPIRLAIVETPAVVETYEDGTSRELEPAQRVVLLNPEIVKLSREEIMRQEGCLSLPGWIGEVPRATWVTVAFQDLQGKKQRLRKIGGFVGWAIQHEVDHLNGVLFTERIRDLATLRELSSEDEDETPDEHPAAAANTSVEPLVRE